MAGVKPITIDQGAHYQAVLTLTDSAGAVIDITGATVAMQARKSIKSASTVLDIASPTEITVDGAAGKITILITHTVTAAIPAGTYVYDVEMTELSGFRRRLMQGSLEVLAEVTR